MVKHIAQGKIGCSRLFGIIAAIILVSATSSFAARHDPMRPQVVSVVGTAEKVVVEELHLEAIVVSGQRRVAIIDGNSLQSGSSYHGYRVKTITPTSVTLTGHGTQKHLTLQPSIVTRIKTSDSK